MELAYPNLALRPGYVIVLTRYLRHGYINVTILYNLVDFRIDEPSLYNLVHPSANADSDISISTWHLLLYGAAERYALTTEVTTYGGQRLKRSFQRFQNSRV